MKTRFAAVALLLLSAATPATAHRLDEYLQAATIDLAKDHVAVEIRLTPGVEVFAAVLAGIDTDGDGIISDAERQAYAGRVLGDLSLTLDAKPVPLRLTSFSFPKLEQMKEGLGDIVLTLDASVPAGGTGRRLVFENHHQPRLSVYLANCLFPSDPDLHVTAQNRKYDQSVYQVDYTQPGLARRPLPPASWSSIRGWLIADAAVLLSVLALLWRRRRGSASRQGH
jgi:hypothetical protein